MFFHLNFPRGWQSQSIAWFDSKLLPSGGPWVAIDLPRWKVIFYQSPFNHRQDISPKVMPIAEYSRTREGKDSTALDGPTEFHYQNLASQSLGDNWTMKGSGSSRSGSLERSRPRFRQVISLAYFCSSVWSCQNLMPKTQVTSLWFLPVPHGKLPCSLSIDFKERRHSYRINITDFTELVGASLFSESGSNSPQKEV